jgi:hypothetical protein
MIYTYSDNVPKSTPALSKRRTIMTLCRGIVHKVEVQFPVGCSEVAKCTINDALHQVWPSNGGAFFASDGHVISFEESYEILTRPYVLDLWCWNDSTEFPHNITVNIGILPKKSMVHYIIPEAINMILRK